MNIVVTIIELAICVLVIAGMWKVFVKAGQPGWAAIIPIYNIYILLTILKKPIWWIILCLIPIVNIIVMIILSMELAVCFGKSKGWGIGLLVILPFIGYPILGFGDAQFKAP